MDRLIRLPLPLLSVRDCQPAAREFQREESINLAPNALVQRTPGRPGRGGTYCLASRQREMALRFLDLRLGHPFSPTYRRPTGHPGGRACSHLACWPSAFFGSIRRVLVCRGRTTLLHLLALLRLCFHLIPGRMTSSVPLDPDILGLGAPFQGD